MFWQAIDEFIQTGGAVLWALMVLTVIIWTLVLERYWFFMVTFRARRRQRLQYWQARPDKHSWAAHQLRNGLIATSKAELRLPLPALKGLVTLCPLMGLLGTVTGMIEVFEVLSVQGQSDPKLMSSGVAKATIPTMAGMVIALSALYFVSRFNRRADMLEAQLADQLRFELAPALSAPQATTRPITT